MPGGRHKGSKDKKPERIHKVSLPEEDMKKMKALLSKSTLESLNFAYMVLKDKSKIKIQQYTKTGEIKKYEIDKYPPDIKIKIFEILIDKVFADKKIVGLENDDPDRPNVVAFSFIPVQDVNK